MDQQLQQHVYKQFYFRFRHNITMVKIFIGNFPDVMLVTNDNVRPLFEAHGIVTYILELPLFIREAFKNKNDETYGKVHM